MGQVTRPMHGVINRERLGLAAGLQPATDAVTAMRSPLELITSTVISVAESCAHACAEEWSRAKPSRASRCSAFGRTAHRTFKFNRPQPPPTPLTPTRETRHCGQDPYRYRSTIPRRELAWSIQTCQVLCALGRRLPLVQRPFQAAWNGRPWGNPRWSTGGVFRSSGGTR